MKTPQRRISRSITPDTIDTLVPNDTLQFPLNTRQLESLVRQALKEDGAFNDLTTIAIVLSDRRGRASIIARAPGIIAGVPLAVSAFRQLDPKIAIRVDVDDGGRVVEGTTVLHLNGHTRALLSAERVALNFLQRLSGIATLTSRYVEAVRGTNARILDTRKTTPGLRILEKYAVRAGGGTNHRLDLSDAVLIKDNHLAAVEGDVGLAVRRARELAPAGARLEVECETREQVEAALEAGADIVLFDNMGPELLAECVTLVRGRAETEASGGLGLDSVRRAAETGVDRISIGALTHSAPALDLALEFESPA